LIPASDALAGQGDRGLASSQDRQSAYTVPPLMSERQKPSGGITGLAQEFVRGDDHWKTAFVRPISSGCDALTIRTHQSVLDPREHRIPHRGGISDLARGTLF
jgi:hypothetical protein